jgi:hypothetical protein
LEGSESDDDHEEESEENESESESEKQSGNDWWSEIVAGEGSFDDLQAIWAERLEEVAAAEGLQEKAWTEEMKD